MPNKQSHHHTLGISHRGGLNLVSHIRYTLSLISHNPNSISLSSLLWRTRQRNKSQYF
ncbi:hypothetical protein HanRHA438_Chr14g0635801 [Helianthus annuus]|uniref:Uncharacterized protein n=1 Tax=Helianthus annuus TaxID=4232 RepID=A0A251SE79_HELAN|nr:hypothetical protein HanXRQr2_Chr14g0625831 [Helianthus annuus]KAJ0463090.1 hypothetical protein HanHA300_Chr14g0511291 [Helianthus annuus]KAJ0466912.1 hypothetical protein HanIR_Chr14g0677401 [Helianthus annuus]KAJ0484456.1 hypothetical protein HanHA89_Chr14g0544291 [Helianthus annuus]KAJ0655012.1 hypothetical protein HanLR1_Chr14g0513591 [Helianthus annuus]